VPEGAATLELLSEAWVAAFAEATSSLPERPGATATVSTMVTGGPDGPKAERAWRFELRDGRVASAAVGAAPEGEADLAVTQPWDDALGALRGTLPIDESFMRGNTKFVGSTGRFMDLLPVLRSDEWRAACESVAARTAG
jgi:hypothetical protein